MLRFLLSVFAGFFIAVSIPPPASALQYLTGHITVLEPTYLPGRITLQLDTGNAACPAGRWLQWVQGANSHQDIDAVYSTMLSALLSNRRVNFVINDNDSTCTGQFFHITSQQ